MNNASGCNIARDNSFLSLVCERAGLGVVSVSVVRFARVRASVNGRRMGARGLRSAVLL